MFSRLPMQLGLSHPRSICAQAGCTTQLCDGGIAMTAQMWVSVMNNWNTKHADWKLERQQFDADSLTPTVRSSTERAPARRSRSRSWRCRAPRSHHCAGFANPFHRRTVCACWTTKCGSRDTSTFAVGSVRSSLPGPYLARFPANEQTLAARICYRAVLENRIQLRGGGVQKQLDALAATREFCTVYADEIAARKLALQDVERCRKNIYHELSKHAYGNAGTILIRRMDFTPNVVAAVVSYYKMQDAWGDALAWLEIGGK